mmetsp:Transcript_18903/g.42118  ORF Transcript_18903/g.42118 Transcript_18903/m.42118 type:complete len:185 (+) Transcript_18903:62-616(+)
MRECCPVVKRFQAALLELKSFRGRGQASKAQQYRCEPDNVESNISASVRECEAEVDCWLSSEVGSALELARTDVRPVVLRAAAALGAGDAEGLWDSLIHAEAYCQRLSSMLDAMAQSERSAVVGTLLLLAHYHVSDFGYTMGKWREVVIGRYCSLKALEVRGREGLQEGLDDAHEGTPVPAACP